MSLFDNDPAGTTSRRWELTRVALGGMYLLGGVTHVALGVLVPDLYTQFADRALLDGYTALWRALVAPNLAVLQPLVTLFEFALALALWSRGRVVLTGHALGAAFQAALVLSGPWGPVNAGLAVLHLAALRRSYPRTVVDLVQRRLGPASP